MSRVVKKSLKNVKFDLKNYNYYLEKKGARVYYRVVPKKKSSLNKKNSSGKIYLWAILTVITALLTAFAAKLPQTVTKAETPQYELASAQLEEISEGLNTEIAEEPEVQEISYNGVCAEWYDLVSQYDWDVNLMLAIMKAESNCNPNATGDTNITYQNNGRTYGYSVSLFQVRILEGREHCDTHNPEINVQCAYNIYKSQGLKAWSVYTNGRYLKYLSQ